MRHDQEALDGYDDEPSEHDDPKKARIRELVGDGSKGVELQLRHPLEDRKGEALEVLHFRPLKGRHLRALPLGKLELDDLLKLAGKMSGQTDAVIGNLTGEDIGSVVDVVSRFLELTLGSGEPN